MRKILLYFFILIFHAMYCNRAAALEIDSLQNIVITVTFASPPGSFTVSKTPLRFDKRFAYSFQIDDGGKDIYTHGFPFFEGGSVAGTTFPGLKYTDGCGNDHFFKMSTSLFSFSAYGGGLTDMHDPNSAYAPINVTWPEVIELYQNKWGVSNHGLTSSSSGDLAYDIARNHSYVKLKTQAATPGGIDMGIFVNPNGAEAYTPYAFAQGYLVCYREGYTFGYPSFDVTSNWDHNQIKMGRVGVGNNANLPLLVDNMATASAGSARHWGVHFTHAVNNGGYGYDFATFQTVMNYVANTYGKGGQDIIWMTTEEEILDYLLIKDAITVNTVLNGAVLTITFSGNIPSSYNHYAHSLKVSANQPITAVTATGVSSVTYNGTGTNNSLINIAWNGHYVVPPEVNAEYWVSKAEASHSQEDANVAMDYVLMVPAGAAQQAFRLRLCTITGVTLPASFCNMRNAPKSTVGTLNACPNTQITLPVTVTGFTNITSVNLRLEYDPTLVSFISGEAGKPTVLPGMTVTSSPVGGGSSLNKITVTWAGTTPKSLASGDTLVKFLFADISGTLPVVFNTASDGGNDCEFKDENGNVMIDFPSETYYTNGKITNTGLPAPGVISGPGSVCPATTGHIYSVSPVTGATGYSWSFPSGFTPTSGQSNSAITLAASASAQSGQIMVKALNACPDNPSSPPLALTVKPKPEPTVSGTGAVCAITSGVTYTTEPGMVNYIWTVSAGGTLVYGSGTSQVQVTWITPGSQTVMVDYAGANGCFSTSPGVQPVTVNQRAVPTITGSATGCTNSTSVYTTEAGQSSYLWTVSPGGTIVSGESTHEIVVAWSTPGAKTVNVNYSNAAGCQAITPVSKNVTVYLPPTPGIIGPASVCVGSGNLVYYTDPGMGAYVWTISPGGTITSGAGTNVITVSWNETGNQNLGVAYTSAAGCAAITPTIKNVTVKPLPVPQVTGPDTLCKGSLGISYSTDPGMSGYIWNISPGGSIVNGLNTAMVQVNWNNHGPQWVSVNYTGSNGCAAASPAVRDVTVNPLPSPSVTGIDSLCAGGTCSYTTDAGMTGYQWSVPAGGIILSGAGTASILVMWTTPGLHNVFVNYTDALGCTAANPATRSVRVFSLPVPSISGPSVKCAGSSGVGYATEPGMSGYLWTVTPGGVITSGQGTGMVTVTWTGSGVQSVGVTYTNSNGCQPAAPVAKNVTVLPQPVPTIIGPDSVCVNAIAYYFTEPGMSNYLWSIGEGGMILSGSNSSILTVQWITPGTKSVTVTYTSPDGCLPQQPAVKQVLVYYLTPTVIGPASVCAATTGVVYTTEPGMINYAWSVSAGGVITAGQGTNSVIVSWNAAGFQMVSASYTNQSGCSTQVPASLQVTVHQRPAPTITGNTSLCANTGSYPYTTEQGMTGYQWTVSPGGTIIGGQGTPVVQVSWVAGGTQSVEVTYQNAAGCSPQVPAVLPVSVQPLPDPAGLVSGVQSVCKPMNGVVYSIAPVNNATGYLWNLPPGTTIVAGANTWMITVNYSNNAQGGFISAAGTNTCGPGSFSPPLNISVHPHPVTPVISQVAGDTLVSSADTGNQWYFQNTPIPGATGSSHRFTRSGSYYSIVTLYDCPSDTSNVIQAVVTGAWEHTQVSPEVFPNPAIDWITVKWEVRPGDHDITVTITDLTGREYRVAGEPMTAGMGELHLDVQMLPAGCYLLRLHTGSTVFIRKFLVNR